MNKLSNALFFILGLAFMPAAYATDGVIEINHARALAGGITPGDTQGYPVTISQAGSYRLTSNLTQSDPNIDVIDIDHDNVTLDLNGFTISGSNVCTLSADAWPGKTISCNGMGTGRGVYAYGNVSVVNGNINGMGAGCILIFASDPGQAQRVENVRVSHCGGTGIGIGKASVTRSGASFCAGDGIYLTTGEISAVFAEGNGVAGISGINVSISGSTVRNNLHTGIYASHGIVSNSVATHNQEAGINSSLGAFNNIAGENGLDGILVDTGTASGNTATGNGENGITIGTSGTASGNTATGNGGNGIYLASGTASGNTVNGNSLSGIFVWSAGAIVGNTIVVTAASARGLTVGPSGYATASQNTITAPTWLQCTNPLGPPIVSAPPNSNACNGLAW
jgi:hypothetical protein